MFERIWLPSKCVTQVSCIAVVAVMMLVINGCISLNVWAAAPEGKKTTVVGDVFDAACYFTRSIDKPIGHECALQCAAGGSPLIIVTKEGQVFWPVDKAMPAVGQNSRLVKFGGLKVKVVGKVYERDGSRAIVMETIEEVK